MEERSPPNGFKTASNVSFETGIGYVLSELVRHFFAPSAVSVSLMLERAVQFWIGGKGDGSQHSVDVSQRILSCRSTEQVERILSSMICVCINKRETTRSRQHL